MNSVGLLRPDTSDLLEFFDFYHHAGGGLDDSPFQVVVEKAKDSVENILKVILHQHLAINSDRTLFRIKICKIIVAWSEDGKSIRTHKSYLGGKFASLFVACGGMQGVDCVSVVFS